MDFLHPIFQSLLLLISTYFFVKFLALKFRQRRLGKKYHPVAGTILNLSLNFNRLHDYMTHLAKRHKTYRLLAPTRSSIFTSDPVVVEYIYSKQILIIMGRLLPCSPYHQSCLEPHIFISDSSKNSGQGLRNYTIMEDLLGSGIFAVDGDKWRQQRKFSSHEFSTKVLKNFSSLVFRQNAGKLANIISEASNSNQSFDIQNLFMNAALDSIFEVALGVELDSLRGSSEEGVNFCKAFDDSSAATLWRFLDPLWKLKKYFNIRSEAKLKENIKVVDAFVYKLINNKVKDVQNKQLDGSSMSKEDIVTRFLHLPEAADPKLLRDIVLSFIIAGKDTTGSTLSWFIYRLCKYPHLQEKIAQEVKSAILNDEKVKINLSKFEDNISEEALEKMQYLHAALTETLRLHPAIPLVSKNCFSDDILPDGFSVNRGDTISYTPYAMGRMKSIWGENAEDFEPERWLDENGNFQTESPFKFTAFQAGPRICLGKEFAYRQMKIISAVLLGCFMFKLKDEKEAVNYRTMISLQIDGGLHVHAFPRV